MHVKRPTRRKLVKRSAYSVGRAFRLYGAHERGAYRTLPSKKGIEMGATSSWGTHLLPNERTPSAPAIFLDGPPDGSELSA
jgi:hypothetical protein